MNWINTNAIHNYLNAAITALAGLQLSDWALFVSEATALKVILGITVLKTVMNLARDGVSGLVKVQPPVEGAQ